MVHNEYLLRAGSCLDIMRYAYKDGFKDEALLATILYNALVGIQYLHEQSRLHRDIKAGNILIETDGSVRLGDFGVSAVLNSHDEKRTTFVG